MKTSFVKLSFFSLLCALPALWLGWRFIEFNLGANPVETLEHETGIWSLYFLLLTLASSAMQKRWRPKWFMPFHLVRRVLGLSAVLYGLLHLTIFWLFDMEMSWMALWQDIWQRPFILIGTLALLLLIPLAVTSTLGWQQRLRKNWRKLHLLIYPISALALLHFIWLTKADYSEPLFYTVIFAVLALYLLKPFVRQKT